MRQQRPPPCARVLWRQCTPTQIFPLSNLPVGSPHVPRGYISPPCPQQGDPCRLNPTLHPPPQPGASSPPASQVSSSSSPSNKFHAFHQISTSPRLDSRTLQLSARQACVSHTTVHPDRQTWEAGRRAGFGMRIANLLISWERKASHWSLDDGGTAIVVSLLGLHRCECVRE